MDIKRRDSMAAPLSSVASGTVPPPVTAPVE